MSAVFDRLAPADLEEIADAQAFALRFDGGKSNCNACSIYGTK